MNNAVYAWGDNVSGQLGNADLFLSPTAVPVTGITGTIVSVKAGSTSSYALDDDGSIWVWGGNGQGQLGLGTTDAIYYTPQHLLPPTGYTYTGIAAGATSSTAAFLANMVGDFNRDDLVDAADIDLLFLAPQGVPAAGYGRYDVTGDHSVKSTPNLAASDADYWVKTIKHTAYGDANLDGKVNFFDLLILASNYNLPTGGWASGSFDGVLGVNFSDLLMLAANYGFGTSGAVVEGEFSADWALAQSMVPEPTALLAMAAGALVLRRR
ncbi:MAG: hypothetical protein QM770_20625 [Tepidisphaeraceae bacterium]